jgi:ABC-type glutathione transport system ATPase component
MHALEVNDLWKGYAAGVRGCSARVSVLRGVTFHLAHGERMAIVGAAGSGKTTLLHCIAGLRRPDAGSIRLSERATTSLLLLDEGMLERTLQSAQEPPATLIFAREIGRVRDRVERVLLLRAGRLIPLDWPTGGPRVARRVAERPG